MRREEALRILREHREDIKEYGVMSLALFGSDELVQDAVIGEAAGRVPAEMQSRHPEIPWGHAQRAHP
jgi:uncharacterized protein with HEPN domain